jgi:hypothetical protein
LDFDDDPNPQHLQLWEIMRHLVEILGDHRLQFCSIASERVLVKSPLPWRGRGSLRTSLAAMTNRQFWIDAQPAFSDLCALEVRRGTAENRHFTWWMKYEPRATYGQPPMDTVGLPSWELAISVAHIPEGAGKSVQSLVDTVFRIGSESRSCAGGRAGLVQRVPIVVAPRTDLYAVPDTDHYRPMRGEGSLHRDHIWRARPAGRPLIPFIARTNLLAPGHLKKFGGMARLRRAADDLTSEPEYPAFTPTSLKNGYAKLQFADIDEDYLSVCEDGYDHIGNVGYRWVVQEAAGAGMFVFQSDHWEANARVAARHARMAAAEAVEYQRSAGVNASFTGMSKAELRAELAYLWSNPPRCVRDVAVAVLPGESEASGPHDCTTEFWIRPNTRDEAFAVYGTPMRDTNQLGSPIRVGAVRRERAAFTFDMESDGWDGEFSTRERLLRPHPRRTKQFVCPECQGRMFKLRAAFEYPLDGELASDKAAWSHRQDYFTWFWLLARCAACDWRGTVGDCECA